jgi:hypothetical protein
MRSRLPFPLSLRVLSPILMAVALLVGVVIGRRSWREPPAATPDSAAKGASASYSGPKLSVPANQAVIGYLDMVDGMPVIVAVRGGEASASGWAACVDAGTPLSKIEVLVDDAAKAEVTGFYSRPDVAAAYNRPDFEKSGWKATFSTTGLKPGEHRITARANCEKGASGVLPPFRLLVAGM